MIGVRCAVRPILIVVALLAACELSGCSGSGGNEATVSVLGSWTGAEKDGFLAMVRGFEAKNGYRIQVNYNGTRDAPAVLANDFKNGHPPDLAVLATPGVMDQYAAEGALFPIDGALNLQTMDRQYGSSWLKLMQATGPSGTKGYYAIIVKAALKSVIWYNPSQFPARYLGLLTSTNLTWNQLSSMTEHLAAAGSPPWCIGMADSSNSGWPGTDWIEDIVLHQSGLQVYDQWVAGTLPWASAPITQAWQTFGQVATTSRLVQGGTPYELATAFETVGQPMFTSPPGCYLDHEGSFITGYYAQDTLGGSSSGSHPQPGSEFNFIPFPAITSADRNNLEVAGDLLGMFHDTPAARELLAYLTTPQAQEVWITRPGSGAISVNRDVPADNYPDPVSRDLAQILTRPVNVRFDASDSMPPTMQSAFYNAVLEYLDNPSQLRTILQGLDQVRKAAYPSPGFNTGHNGT
jgi:alpha-glucoside transport system substrate-binding protein